MAQRQAPSMTHDTARVLIVTWDDMDMITYCEAMEAHGFASVSGWTLEHAAEALQAGTIDLALLRSITARNKPASPSPARSCAPASPPFSGRGAGPGETRAAGPDGHLVAPLPVGSPAMMAAITRALQGRAFLDPDGPRWLRAARRQ